MRTTSSTDGVGVGCTCADAAVHSASISHAGPRTFRIDLPSRRETARLRYYLKLYELRCDTTVLFCKLVGHYELQHIITGGGRTQLDGTRRF